MRLVGLGADFDREAEAEAHEAGRMEHGKGSKKRGVMNGKQGSAVVEKSKSGEGAKTSLLG